MREDNSSEVISHIYIGVAGNRDFLWVSLDIGGRLAWLKAKAVVNIGCNIGSNHHIRQVY